MESSRGLELKVGVFVVVGFLLLFGAIWSLGGEESFFDKTYTLHTSFSDVAGLRDGATVQVAGMSAGLVRNIRFSSKPEDKELHVDLVISQRYQDRIRKDSLATVATQGVLGDKYINLSVGTPTQPELKDGEWIQRKNPTDLFASLGGIAEDLGAAIRGPGGKAAGKSIVEMLDAVRNVLKEVEEGKGLIHHLVYEESPGQKVDSLLTSLNQGGRSLERILKEVEKGDGTAHALVYGEEGSRAIAELSQAASKLDGLLADIKSENGVLHSLIYADEKGSNIIANLTAVSSDLHDITTSIKKGEGTIGGLVADPSVYQDLKTLLGRAERNKLLKAFIRANMRRNEAAEGVAGGGATR